MNWGYGITIFFVSFVIFMVAMVVKCFQQDFDLVAVDYYKQELEYQHRIDKINNTSDLEYQVNFVTNTEQQQLELVFSENIIVKEGKIYFYRPTNAAEDVTFDLQLEQGKQTFDKRNFGRGKWTVQVEWNHKNTEYFKEFTLLL